MEKLVVAIYDGKAEMFNEPMLVISRGAILREFMDMINDDPKSNKLARHPEDFSLWVIAKYDERKGIYTNLDKQELIAKGIELKEVK